MKAKKRWNYFQNERICESVGNEYMKSRTQALAPFANGQIHIKHLCTQMKSRITLVGVFLVRLIFYTLHSTSF